MIRGPLFFGVLLAGGWWPAAAWAHPHAEMAVDGPDAPPPLIERVDLALPGAQSDADRGYFGPDAGLWEFTLAGAGESDTDFESSGSNVAVEANYYLSQSFSLGLRQSLSIVEANADSSFNATTSVFTQYHFGQGQLRPFVGLEVGYLYGNGVTETALGGVEAGTRFYIRDNTFLFSRATYEFLLTSSDDADERFDDARLVYSFGVGFSF